MSKRKLTPINVFQMNATESEMKYNIIFKTYITDFDIDPEEVGRGQVWLENDKLKIKITSGDPYFIYSCVKDSTIEEAIKKRLKSSRRTAYAHNDIISMYVSRNPELFVREPLDTALLPPKYRFSSSPRITAPDENGLEYTRNHRYNIINNFQDIEEIIAGLDLLEE